jgi:D-arabinonate dehydratase/D-galactarolactone cycloisomerase
MKIVSVEAFAIEAPPASAEVYWGARAWGREHAGLRDHSAHYPVEQRRRFIYSRTIDTVIVKVTTDEGAVGYGEAKAPVAARATRLIVETLLAPMLIGANPLDTTVLWERMYAGMRVRGHQAGFYLEAISGIDIALWDIAGKASGRNIASLLGGAFNDKVRVYASGLPSLPQNAPDEAFEALGDQAEAIRKAGYSALKMAFGRDLPGDIRSAHVVRERLGSDFTIHGDAAGSYDRKQALRLGLALQDLDFGFYEMPIFPEDIEGYAELARRLTMPIALDSLMTRQETLRFLRIGGLDLVQPDVCRAGGITECRRIAELADTFGAAFAPHISIGSAIHFAASTHLAAAMPNTMTSEYWIGNNPIGNAILETPLRMENGFMELPSGPGLGIAIKEDALLRFAAPAA